ncbi:MAG: aminotransferase [Trueperaceae bacterium]|nr:aminotransferase [Trueperaceae bacterium]
MSRFKPFLMERMMSKYEQKVDYNLSESGVHPIYLRELYKEHPDELAALLDSSLNYPHVNGLPELRSRIANLYEGAREENVLVTVGGIEANFIATRSLLEPGQEMVLMLPNYMQIWGLAKDYNFNLKTFRLLEENSWAPDLTELEEQVTTDTKVIVVCNPNNPTGKILSEKEMAAVVAIADRVGAWILADEVYRGAERLEAEMSPSFYGQYDRVLATGSMSKAYGMPGLRIGWLLGPPKMLERAWEQHEYITLAATMMANKIASFALSPDVWPVILERTRGYIRRGWSLLENWLEDQGNIIQVTAPQAAAIAFLHYGLKINSSKLADKLRNEQSVLIVPGDHFGMDEFLRVSFGLPRDNLIAGLNRVSTLMKELVETEGKSE